jgi:hypothetical protein
MHKINRSLLKCAALGAVLLTSAGCIMEPAPPPAAVGYAPAPYYAEGPYYYPEYPPYPYYAYGPAVGVGVGYYGGRGWGGGWRGR